MKGIFNWIGQQPHRALWISLPFILLVGWLNRDSAIDIQIHDTYIVTEVFSITIFALVYFSLLSGIYYLLRTRQLSSWMNVLHIVCSVFLILLITTYRRGDEIGAFGYARIDGRSPQDLANSMEYALVIASLLFIMVQLVFLINVIIALVKKKKPLE